MEIETPVLVARLSQDDSDILAIQKFRINGFPGGQTGTTDCDGFDHDCHHIMVLNRNEGTILGCLRVRRFSNGCATKDSYANQYYNLDSFSDYPFPLMELGRFCVAPGREAADVIRLIWAILARLVDRYSIKMLFGCTSFAGTQPKKYQNAFGLLASKYMGPTGLRPTMRPIETVEFGGVGFDTCNLATARTQLPPLLRSYLSLGGWVGDHGVVDRQLSTIHVFTAVEIGKIPEGRARRLRNLAA